MKIAYLLTWDITSNDGVTQKVRSQAEYWIRLGHKVKIFCIVNRNKRINNLNSNELIFRTFRKHILKTFLDIWKTQCYNK